MTLPVRPLTVNFSNVRFSCALSAEQVVAPEPQVAILALAPKVVPGALELIWVSSVGVNVVVVVSATESALRAAATGAGPASRVAATRPVAARTTRAASRLRRTLGKI